MELPVGGFGFLRGFIVVTGAEETLVTSQIKEGLSKTHHHINNRLNFEFEKDTCPNLPTCLIVSAHFLFHVH